MSRAHTVSLEAVISGAPENSSRMRSILGGGAALTAPAAGV
jgi:hypothetical protein